MPAEDRFKIPPEPQAARFTFKEQRAHLAGYRRSTLFRTLMLMQGLAAIGALWIARVHRDLWMQRANEVTVVLSLVMALYVVWLKRAMQAQVDTREASEQELRRERSRLEQRVDERTAELRAEVRERTRAEGLNRGRNRVLEMVARDEPTQKILQTLAETAANYHSTWMCAVHLLDGETLTLTASSGLPPTLAERLKLLTTTMADAPEAAAIRDRQVRVVPELCQEHKTWCELLVANGAQSAWCAPFLASGGRVLGTMSIYTLLKYTPVPADIELVEMSCQMASLVMERHHMTEELVYSAYHDSLTGLGNRRHGKMGLEAAIQRARRSNKGVAVLWFDLNKFKQINDVHGHRAGDHVLKAVANRLAGRARVTDMLARMGGDEFMLVLEGLSCRADGEDVAVDLLELIAQPLSVGEMTFHVTASIGMSFYPEDGDTAEVLEQHADMAMYEAKFGGLGLSSFTAGLKEESAERKQIEAGMARALEHGGFSLLYQPQCLPSGELAGFEALLRFRHPDLGVVPPSRFIPIAEDTQLILPIGRWALEEVCRQIRAWMEEGHRPVPVAVNISALQFVGDDFSAEVAAILAETGVSPNLLELELTESTVMGDFAESARQMEKLKELGVQIAIDDFGTGYSSLSYLHRLPIGALKIDRSFVEMINEREGTLRIVEAVISMAHTLGLRVVGEGVETAAQMESLRQSGCDVLQGYLFSRPVGAAHAAEFLRSGMLEPGAPATELRVPKGVLTMWR